MGNTVRWLSMSEKLMDSKLNLLHKTKNRRYFNVAQEQLWPRVLPDNISDSESLMSLSEN